MKKTSIPTLLFGLLLIAVLTPLSQFLTIMTMNSSMETFSPAGWAVGLLISFSLCALAFRTLAKREWIERHNLVLLYAMLTIAVPVMNLGLVRQFYLSSYSVLREYMYQGTSTYRTAYDALDTNWFPVAPTTEGMAWNMSDRVLRLLNDAAIQRSQNDARRLLSITLTDEDLFHEVSEEIEANADSPRFNELIQAVEALGPDGVNDVLALGELDRAGQLGILNKLQEKQASTAQSSQEAVTLLRNELIQTNELVVSMLPSNLAIIDLSSRNRLENLLEQMPDSEESALQQQVATLQTKEAYLRSLVARLSNADASQVRQYLMEDKLSSWDNLGQDAIDSIRHSFIFRLSRDERRRIIQEDGTQAPNQNLFAFKDGLRTGASGDALRNAPLTEKITHTWQAIPWQLWLKPLLLWGTLITSIFMFLMCVAEWLRRKWVSKENLTFPLVEIADYVIRHDYRLELASDSSNPEKRKRLFYPPFLIGCAIGLIAIFLEGMGHYGFMPGNYIIEFNFNTNIFDATGGAFRDISPVVFTLSPIIIGIVFLLSLEVGFSIWVTFFVYTGAVWVTRLMFPDQLTDSAWTGYSNARIYPYAMEQMLGAALCFTLVILYKSWKPGKLDPAREELEAYLPRTLNRLGLILLPPFIFVLLWNLGITNLPLILLVAVIVMAMTIASTRVRAETGLPMWQTHYELTKVPIIFGMTGFTGSKVFAAFLNIVFLPVTLLFRTLPQQLENIELARRYKLKASAVAFGSLAAFMTALAVGMISFITFAYYMGDSFYAMASLPPGSSQSSPNISTYPLWISHFLGEPGLDKFTTVNIRRLSTIFIGFSVVALLVFLRRKFLKFPIHPIGYLVILLSTHFDFIHPYQPPGSLPPASTTIWGSVLVAWIIKRLIVKFGGMNTYKRSKPFFVGLVIGAIAMVFLWNATDLIISLMVAGQSDPGPFFKHFTDVTPFTPVVY